jgi:hypothetical protein
VRAEINALLGDMDEGSRSMLVRSLFPRPVSNLNALTDEERAQVLEGVRARVEAPVP